MPTRRARRSTAYPPLADPRSLPHACALRCAVPRAGGCTRPAARGSVTVRGAPSARAEPRGHTEVTRGRPTAADLRPGGNGAREAAGAAHHRRAERTLRAHRCGPAKQARGGRRDGHVGRTRRRRPHIPHIPHIPHMPRARRGQRSRSRRWREAREARGVGGYSGATPHATAPMPVTCLTIAFCCSGISKDAASDRREQGRNPWSRRQ